jgi:hypothetical protein
MLRILVIEWNTIVSKCIGFNGETCQGYVTLFTTGENGSDVAAAPGGDRLCHCPNWRAGAVSFWRTRHNK